MAPEILDLGPFSIQGYGLLIALGIVAAWLVVVREARRAGPAQLEGHLPVLLLTLLAAAFAGGKLAFVLGDPRGAREILERGGVTALAREGFVFYGSLLLCVPAAVWILRRSHLPVLRGADVLLLGTSILHALGRVGCFLSGCCYGSRSDVPWAVTFRHGHGLNGVPLHPTQLYEAGGELAIFAFLWLCPRRRARFPGQMALTYLALYAGLRFLTELLRGDGNPVVLAWTADGWSPGAPPLGLTLSQLVSLVVLAVSLPLLARGLRRGQKGSSPGGGASD